MICDVHQTWFLLSSEPYCFEVKNVFGQSKIAAIKTLTSAYRTFKKGYCMHIAISTQINLI